LKQFLSFFAFLLKNAKDSIDDVLWIMIGFTQFKGVVSDE